MSLETISHRFVEIGPGSKPILDAEDEITKRRPFRNLFPDQVNPSYIILDSNPLGLRSDRERNLLTSASHMPFASEVYHNSLPSIQKVLLNKHKLLDIITAWVEKLKEVH